MLCWLFKTATHLPIISPQKMNKKFLILNVSSQVGFWGKCDAMWQVVEQRRYKKEANRIQAKKKQVHEPERKKKDFKLKLHERPICLCCNQIWYLALKCFANRQIMRQVRTWNNEDKSYTTKNYMKLGFIKCRRDWGSKHCCYESTTKRR